MSCEADGLGGSDAICFDHLRSARGEGGREEEWAQGDARDKGEERQETDVPSYKLASRAGEAKEKCDCRPSSLEPRPSPSAHAWRGSKYVLTEKSGLVAGRAGTPESQTPQTSDQARITLDHWSAGRGKHRTRRGVIKYVD